MEKKKKKLFKITKIVVNLFQYKGNAFMESLNVCHETARFRGTQLEYHWTRRRKNKHTKPKRRTLV